jgi:hypothetical protein
LDFLGRWSALTTVEVSIDASAPDGTPMTTDIYDFEITGDALVGTVLVQIVKG